MVWLSAFIVRPWDNPSAIGWYFEFFPLGIIVAYWRSEVVARHWDIQEKAYQCIYTIIHRKIKDPSSDIRMRCGSITLTVILLLPSVLVCVCPVCNVFLLGQPSSPIPLSFHYHFLEIPIKRFQLVFFSYHQIVDYARGCRDTWWAGLWEPVGWASLKYLALR